MAALLKWTVKDIREMIEGRIYNNFDAIVVIDANGAIEKRGIGKSTLGYKIAGPLKIPLKFKAKRDLVYSREDSIKHLAKKKFGIIFYDEMINVSYKRDFQNQEQIKLIKALNMYRDSCNVYIMCVPNFWDLDIDLRKLCSLRITVLQRGTALIQIPSASIYGNDPWDTKYNQKIENDWLKSRSKRPKYSKLTTCVGIVNFGPLHPQVQQVYDEIKSEKRGRVFGDHSGQDDDPKTVFMNNLVDEMRAGKMTPQQFELAAKLQGVDAVRLRIRVNNLLKKRGVKKTWKHFVMKHEKRRKRDLLGFEA